MKVEIEIPESATLGDLITVRGALFHASTTFVDWERLHANDPDAIGPPGKVLLSFADQLKNAVESGERVHD